jgi:hypothetical protein
MTAFQILTRDKPGGADNAAPEIVSYRLPTAMPTDASRSDERQYLPPVVLRLPQQTASRRKLPTLSLAQVRAHASTVVLILGSLLALWLIFGGKRPAEHKPVDEAPAWAAPGPAKEPESASPIVPSLPSVGPAATTSETHSAPPAMPAEQAPAQEAAPLQNPSQPPNLPPLGEPAPQDGTARAMPTEVRTANRPEETRWDGNRVAPGEAAPLGIGTGVPQ